MTVPVVETFAVTNTQGTSQSCTAPAGLVEGDIVLIIFANDGNQQNTVVSGFDLVLSAFQGAVEQWMFIKRATDSEPSSYLVDWAGNERGRCTILRISGCPLTGTALDQVDQIGSIDDAASGTSIFCPAITSTVIDTLAIAGVVADGIGIQGGDGFDTPNGFVVEATPGNNGAIAAGGMVGSKDLPSIGSSLSPEFGWTNSEQNVTFMINLIGISAPPVGFAHSQAVIIG